MLQLLIINLQIELSSQIVLNQGKILEQLIFLSPFGLNCNGNNSLEKDPLFKILIADTIW